MPIDTSKGIIPGIVSFIQDTSHKKKFLKALEDPAVRESIVQGALPDVSKVGPEFFTNPYFQSAISTAQEIRRGSLGNEAMGEQINALRNEQKVSLDRLARIEEGRKFLESYGLSPGGLEALGQWHDTESKGLTNKGQRLDLKSRRLANKGLEQEIAGRELTNRGAQLGLERLQQAFEAAKQSGTTLGSIDLDQQRAAIDELTSRSRAGDMAVKSDFLRTLGDLVSPTGPLGMYRTKGEEIFKDAVTGALWNLLGETSRRAFETRLNSAARASDPKAAVQDALREGANVRQEFLGPTPPPPPSPGKSPPKRRESAEWDRVPTMWQSDTNSLKVLKETLDRIRGKSPSGSGGESPASSTSRGVSKAPGTWGGGQASAGRDSSRALTASEVNRAALGLAGLIEELQRQRQNAAATNWMALLRG